MSKKGKFGLGLLLGAAVGAVAGILTAPKSGKETREDLKAKGKELAEAAKAKGEEISKNTGEFVETAKEKVEDFTHEAGVKTGEAVENAKVEAGKIQKRALNTIEGAKKVSKRKFSFPNREKLNCLLKISRWCGRFGYFLDGFGLTISASCGLERFFFGFCRFLLIFLSFNVAKASPKYTKNQIELLRVIEKITPQLIQTIKVGFSFMNFSIFFTI